MEVSVTSLARSSADLALLGSLWASLATTGPGGVLGTLLDQGRGVPWGGVLTVLGAWAHALLA